MRFYGKLLCVVACAAGVQLAIGRGPNALRDAIWEAGFDLRAYAAALAHDAEAEDRLVREYGVVRLDGEWRAQALRERMDRSARGWDDRGAWTEEAGADDCPLVNRTPQVCVAGPADPEGPVARLQVGP